MTSLFYQFYFPTEIISNLIQPSFICLEIWNLTFFDLLNFNGSIWTSFKTQGSISIPGIQQRQISFIASGVIVRIFFIHNTYSDPL